jgi:hypothetical protein
MICFRVQATAAMVFASLWLMGAAQAGTAVHKCTENGVVTFQSMPCRTDSPGPRPTAVQLNAERQKKLRQQAEAASSATQPPAPAGGAQHQPPTAAPTATANGRFKCDGRTRCTQMSSCAEAKYFLAHCPGVQMDGDKDGIPCEEQWCR